MDLAVTRIGGIVCHQNWPVLSASVPDFAILSVGYKEDSVAFREWLAWAVIRISFVVDFDRFLQVNTLGFRLS